jgi:hypothetical protein
MLGSISGASTSGETKACESQGCQLSCQSSTFRPDTCVVLNQNFLDGTPCQGGGKCGNGRCEGASIGNEIKDWISANKQIVIPVACVLGGIILIAIASCIFGSIKKRTRGAKRRKANAAKTASQMNSWASYGGSFTPTGGILPGNQGRGNIPRGPGPTSPQAAGGAGPGNMPQGPQGPQGLQGPPPSYSPYRPYQPQWGSQGQSMRYA